MRAANEIGLTPKMFGGTFIGLLVTPIKMQLGPLINGSSKRGIPAVAAFTFPGTLELLAKYQAIARTQGMDPMGWVFPAPGLRGGPSAGAGGRSNQEPGPRGYRRLHPQPFIHTVVGDITFGKDGEWAKSRVVFTQFQNVTGNTLDQFKDTTQRSWYGPTSTSPAI